MGQIIWQQDPSGLAVSTCIGPRHFPTGTSPPKLSRTLGREITYVDAPDDAVRDAPPGFGLDEWFVNALVGLGDLPPIRHR
jgi:hypothetical protein